MADANDTLGVAPDISSLSPQQATELLEKLTKDHRAANPADPLAMSEDQATKELASIAKAPPKPVDPVAAAIAGELEFGTMATSTIDSPTLSPHKLAETVTMLRDDLALDDTATEFILRDLRVTEENVAQARLDKATLLGDKDWVRRFLDGDVRARGLMAKLDYVLSARIGKNVKEDGVWK